MVLVGKINKIGEIVGSGSINTLVIKYPSRQKEICDEIITHLNSSFKTPSIDTGY